MSTLTLNALLATALIAGVILTFIGILHKQRRLPHGKDGRISLPPGPPVRFWESAMPKTNISSTFNEWTDTYGPVITLCQGNAVSIVITRVDAATDIMEREGSALADRPPMIAAGDILSGGNRILLTRSGERLRRFRKVFHTHLQPKAVEAYKDILVEHAKTLVLDVLGDPKDHQRLVHRYAASTILRVTYGRSSPTSVDDPAFVGVKRVIDHLNEAMRPGAYLVDRFPWLKYVPGYGRRLKQHHTSDLQFYSEQLDRVQRAMASDGAGPSFSRALLEHVHENRFSSDEMAYLSGTLYEAGSDTTTNAVISMTMAAACFPHAQSRVQAELDKIVGADRLPTWNDWEALPQLHAFISEALRWRPVGPFGVPHSSTRDIFWRGYCIPAGTAVLGNHWSISRDPIVFPDPETFDPRRWLDEHGQLRSDVVYYPFGFGRRVCPGMHLANRSTFIALAFLLWAFHISERPEAPIDTTPDRDSIVARLAPFEVKLVPRMDEARLREMMTM